MAKATGAPVYCPKLEVPVLADIMAWVPWPGIGPFESYDADETLEGGESLELAGFADRRDVRPGPLAGAPRVLDPVRGRRALRRRALPGLDRPHRPARRRPPAAAALDRRAARGAPGRDRACSRATWRRRRSAPSAPPTRSCTNSRRERRRSRPRAARSTCWATTRWPATGSRRPPAASSSPPATSASRRRCSSPRRCSRAAWGSPPTSCRRRCTRSTRATSPSR